MPKVESEELTKVFGEAYLSLSYGIIAYRKYLE